MTLFALIGFYALGFASGWALCYIATDAIGDRNRSRSASETYKGR